MEANNPENFPAVGKITKYLEDLFNTFPDNRLISPAHSTNIVFKQELLVDTDEGPMLISCNLDKFGHKDYIIEFCSTERFSQISNSKVCVKSVYYEIKQYQDVKRYVVLFFNNNYKQSVDTMAQDDLNILLEILKNSIAVRSLYELKEYLRIGDVIKDLEYEFTPLNESSNDRVKKLFTKIGRYIYDTFKVD
jgi:hypothetical protein